MLDPLVGHVHKCHAIMITQSAAHDCLHADCAVPRLWHLLCKVASFATSIHLLSTPCWTLFARMSAVELCRYPHKHNREICCWGGSPAAGMSILAAEKEMLCCFAYGRLHGQAIHLPVARISSLYSAPSGTVKSGPMLQSLKLHFSCTCRAILTTADDMGSHGVWGRPFAAAKAGTVVVQAQGLRNQG